MMKLKDCRHVFDIELTNRCNAQCSFCPRDQTPEQGFISFDTFKKSVERVAELEVLPKLHSAGQGEPTLHPQIIEFAQYVQSIGLPYSLTTNGSLLTEELAEGLMDAGLRTINFSVSDLYEDYEEVYALDFDTTRTNIFRFLEMNKARRKPVEVQVSLVAHDLNRGKLKKYMKFWKKAGVDSFQNWEQGNRGGACDNGHYFLDNNRHMEEATTLLNDNNVSHVCGAPFAYLFIGWNGQYYLCCNDYRKTTPLGSVFDHSVEEMDIIKKAQFFGSKPSEACRNCDLDITNRVREVLFEIEAGDAPANKLDELIREIKKNQKQLPDFILAKESL